MSKLERLIQKYCPDGVGYKTLGEATIMKRGTSATKGIMQEGDIPVISGGRQPAFYCNVSNRTGEVITVAGSGAGAGYVQYWNEPIFVCDAFSIQGNETLKTKYVYYILTNIQEKIYSTKKGGGVPHVHISSIDKFEIPVPPLPVQEEIVRILDAFTELQAELQAELQKRKQQYNYYLDNLLNFKNINRGGYQAEVRWMKMSEVFEIRNGYTPSKAKKEFWEGGTIPWFRMEDIRQNGRILSDSILHITPKGVKGKGLFKANSFILATTATIGEHALIIADSLANQRFTNLSIRKSLENELSVKYVYYYFFVIDEWCKANTNVSNFASIDMSKFYNLLIPIPSIAEQQRIVAILDRFDTLTTDLTKGLPAEIEKRRQQYEYYRDKLLTFKRKGA